jgi:SAM-dependent methyltransferase
MSIRLNVGCGPFPRAGWLNVDRRRLPGVDIQCDLVAGLPLADGCVDCGAAIHVLQDLAWEAIPRLLRDLHRVLVPGGVMRIAVPDLDRAIDAYRSGDAGYFYVPDADARTLGAKLVTQIIWYGSVRTPFTYDFAVELATSAGFAEVRRCEFGETASGIAELAALDNRPRESLFVEARK